ncbi:hypothetical protein [Blastococcus sp. TF02A-30]|uniref:hypothetical protein n=1 Tax=Blastococcus sp. TF02A-30 TaxID=2250580 RepID=UPI000DEB76B3|nr:hypothetical protein [Blastococcus sp. TF02A-30]RBY93007.1 hypothetical protein DQ241_02995 [Blastococcus sp. TF02A-30]
MSSAALPARPSAREHHLPAAAVAAVAVALLVGLPELLGQTGRLAVVLVLQLGLVLSWVLVTGLQGFAGSLAVGAGAAVAADLALVLPERPELGELLAVFGVGFLALVLQQMLRRPRTELVASLAGGAMMLVAVAALGGLLLLERTGSGADRALVALLAVGAALVVGHVVDLLLPRPQLAADVPRGLVGMVLAVVAGAVVAVGAARLVDVLDGVGALVHGTAIGGVAALSALVASFLVVEATATATAAPPAAADDAGAAPAGDEHGGAAAWSLPLIQVALPLAACAPVAVALQSLL